MVSVLLFILATLAPGPPAPDAQRERPVPSAAMVLEQPEAVSALAGPAPVPSPTAGLARILPLGRLDIALLGLGSIVLAGLAAGTQLLFRTGVSNQWRPRRARDRSLRRIWPRGSEPEPVGATILAAP